MLSGASYYCELVRKCLADIFRADKGQFLIDPALFTQPVYQGVSKQWNDREIEMSSPIRRFARVGAATLAIGLAIGATFLAFAREELQPAPNICATPAGDVGGEAPFLAENDVAMKKMMNDMVVTPTGDVDADFVAMMVPHHQGAIDMAVAVLRHSRNPQIRRLAQEIIVTQQQEIAAMRLAVGQPLPPSLPSPTQPSPRPPPDAHTMQ
jgi:hypothetical protein